MPALDSVCSFRGLSSRTRFTSEVPAETQDVGGTSTEQLQPRCIQPAAPSSRTFPGSFSCDVFGFH